jgi:phage terminase Nu1 subunit (DNA packaging protein)
MTTQAEIAAHLNMSARNVRYLLKQGVIPKGGTLDEVRHAYIDHLRAEAGRYGSGDLTGERTRLARAQADREEMKNAQLRGELLARSDVDAAVVGAFSRVRQRLLAIPSKLAPILATKMEPAECEAEVRRAVHDALQELSETRPEAMAAEDV